MQISEEDVSQSGNPWARPTQTQNSRRKWLIRAAQLTSCLLISAGMLYLTLFAVPKEPLLNALKHAKVKWIAISLGMIVINYGLKICRTRSMLANLGAWVSLSEASTIFLGCMALNNVLPFRAGDVIRVVGFRRLMRTQASDQISSLVLERLMDIFVLVVILIATLGLWKTRVLPASIIRGILVAFSAIIAGLAALFFAPRMIYLFAARLEPIAPLLHSVAKFLFNITQAVATLANPRLLFRLLLLSFAAWTFEAGVFYAAARALDVQLSAPASFMALTVGTLSTVIPSSPGYFGTFHYFTAMTLTAFGVNSVVSAACAVLIHALLWVSVTSAGFIFLWITGLGAALRHAAAREAAAQSIAYDTNG